MTNIKSNCVFVMPLHFKAISHSPYRLDILWMRRVIFDFLPNLLNMHCHSRDISYRLHIPDLAKQLFFRIHMIRMTRQKCKKIELLRRK